MRKQLDDYLAHGWIEPAHSAFGTWVLFAKKHDGTKRMCMDYRRLNDLIEKVAYPMPRIDDCLDHMRESSVLPRWTCEVGFTSFGLS